MGNLYGKTFARFFSFIFCAGLFLNLGAASFAFDFNDALPEFDANLPAGKTLQNRFNSASAETASAQIIKAAASGPAYGDAFNKLAGKNIKNLLSAYYFSKDESLKDKLYFAVLPAVWNNAYLEDTSYY